MSTFTLTTAVTTGVPSPLPFVATLGCVVPTPGPVQVNASAAFSGHEGTTMSTPITAGASLRGRGVDGWMAAKQGSSPRGAPL
jgi:hypothetical protein